MDHALAFNLKNNLISATDFKASIEMLPAYEAHLNRLQAETVEKMPMSKDTQAKLETIRPEVRSLDIYTKILRGEG